MSYGTGSHTTRCETPDIDGIHDGYGHISITGVTRSPASTPQVRFPRSRATLQPRRTRTVRTRSACTQSEKLMPISASSAVTMRSDRMNQVSTCSVPNCWVSTHSVPNRWVSTCSVPDRWVSTCSVRTGAVRTIRARSRLARLAGCRRRRSAGSPNRSAANRNLHS